MFTRSILSLMALAACATALSAQGIVIDRRIRPDPEPRRPAPSVQNIQVKTHAVETVVDGQSATTTVTQTFYNPNSWQMEGTYIFPLPAEAAISDFQMTMNGTMVKGELMNSVTARKIYEDTVRKMIDPGLLEYAGRGLFSARVFPIFAEKDLTIKFTYTELLSYDSGLVRFAYPLRTSKYAAEPPEAVTVKVTLKSENGLHTIYSPTHSCDVTRKGENEAVIGLEMKGSQPANDFELYYGFREGALAANVMSYREGNGAGYFLALLTPKVTLDKDEVLPKDVIVVFDTSGSMEEDGKIEQARKALKFMVSKLNDADRFAVVTYSTEVRPWHTELVEGSAANREAAIAKLEKTEAAGGTNIEGAIREAFKLAGDGKEGRPCYVLFLTDGLPTMGEITDVKGLAKLARDNRKEHVRLFSFGVGNDVNTWLLDTLAEENKGQREYVKPKEDMELKISNLANKIASPVLADVSIKINGAEIHDLHPQIAGDMFAGGQLSITGRFDKPGKHQLLLEGTVNGKKQAFEFSVEFTEADASKVYLPRMWAVRRVGFLMDQINLKGQDKELVDEITRLGTQFGIVTPYTSFLIVEDTPLPAPGAEMPANRPGHGRWAEDGASGGGRVVRDPAAPAAQTGGGAVDRSKSNAERRANDNADEVNDAEAGESERLGADAKKAGLKTKVEERLRRLQDSGLSKDAAEAQAKEIVKTVGTRSFVWSDGIWLESDLTNAELFGAEVVEFMSERYMELAKDSRNAKVMALGNEVIFRVGKKTIRIVETEAAEAKGSDEKEPK